MSYTLVCGDCRVAMREMQPDSVDAIVTDPPYELGFMSKAWDHAGVAFDSDTWRACYRVLRPGGRLLAFGAPRTAHRIWCAIEDAGFVIEDTVMWLFGSGFPKHGSKLKPAYEPICCARKGPVSALNIDECRIGTEVRTNRGMSSLGVVHDDDWKPREVESTVSGRWPANVMLDEEAAALLDEQSGIAPAVTPREGGGFRPAGASKGLVDFKSGAQPTYPHVRGDSGGASRFFYTSKASRSERNYGLEALPKHERGTRIGQLHPGVSAAGNVTGNYLPRQNHHPTVKPVELMRYLVRLVTPNGGTVLDPFCGSGTTGVACTLEGRAFIGIELDSDYTRIAERRIRQAQPSLFAEAP